MIRFEVHGLPPSVNHYWKQKRFCGRYITAEGVAFKKLVQQTVHFKQIPHGNSAMKYKLTIELNSPGWITKKNTIHARADIDNFAKCAIDALCEAIYINDSQIFDLHLIKKTSKEKAINYLLEEIV